MDNEDDLPPGIVRSRPKTTDGVSSPSAPTRPSRAPRARDETMESGRPVTGGKRRPEAEGDGERTPLAQALEDGYLLLSYRNRTMKEMGDRLRRRGYDDETNEAAVAHLQAEGYLNDEAFAARLVESRGAAKGRRAIQHELRQKGIDGETASEALAEGHDAETERAAARAVAVRRVGEQPADRSAPARVRLSSFLARRGFGFDVVRSVVAELFSAEGDASEAAEEFEG